MGTAINDDVQSEVSYHNSEGYYTDHGPAPNKVMLFNDDLTDQYASTSVSGGAHRDNLSRSSPSAFSRIAASPLGQYAKAQGYMVTKAYGFGQEKQALRAQLE